MRLEAFRQTTGRGGILLPLLPVLSFTPAYWFDWYSTKLLLEMGGAEANPFLGWATIWDMLLLKTVAFLPILAILLAAHRLRPRFASFLGGGLVAWYTGVTTWNLSLLAA